MTPFTPEQQRFLPGLALLSTLLAPLTGCSSSESNGAPKEDLTSSSAGNGAMGGNASAAIGGTNNKSGSGSGGLAGMRSSSQQADSGGSTGTISSGAMNLGGVTQQGGASSERSTSNEIQGGTANAGISTGGTASSGTASAHSGGAASSGSTSAHSGGAASGGSTSAHSGGAASGGSTTHLTTSPPPIDGIPIGNPDGHCSIPSGKGADSVGQPTRVVGDGTPASCTGSAVVQAVWNNGNPVNRVTFACGNAPVTIPLTESIKVPNAPSGASTTIDGEGKVTLSGGGKVRILYANACNNALGWYTTHCQDQDSPHVTVQNLTFINGNAASILPSEVDEPSGGAIFMRSGVLKIVNCRFFNNRAIDAAPDFGGGAVRVLGQYNGQSVTVVNSTFGGKSGLGNSAANGAAISSIGTSWTIINSLFTDNSAIGTGANAGNGGNGGAIYNDGNFFNLELCGVKMERNVANEGGGAIFYVSNDGSGTISILDSILMGNISKRFGERGLFIMAKSGYPITTGSTIE